MKGSVTQAIDTRLKELGLIERYVVSWIFGIGGEAVPVSEISSELGVSEDEIADIAERALRRLRRKTPAYLH